MKHLLLITTLAISSYCVQAQTTNGEKGPAPAMNSSASADMFSATTMEVNGNTIQFDNLPADEKVSVCITNDKGGVCMNKKLKGDNTVDISKLSSGLHFVALRIDNKTRKNFVLNR